MNCAIFVYVNNLLNVKQKSYLLKKKASDRIKKIYAAGDSFTDELEKLARTI